MPLTAEASNADRNPFSPAGLGLGCAVSPTVRAISSCNTGFGRNFVSPGSQFLVGMALHRQRVINLLPAPGFLTFTQLFAARPRPFPSRLRP